MGSDVYLKAIERQLKILDVIDRIKASMEKVIELDTLMDEYCHALYTGILEYKFPAEVTVTLTAPEKAQKIRLSDASTEPYGRFVPLYQGFASYIELEEDIRTVIRKETEKRLSYRLTYREQIETARELLHVLKDEKYLVAWILNNAGKFPDRESEILSLYRKLHEYVIDFPPEMQ